MKYYIFCMRNRKSNKIIFPFLSVALPFMPGISVLSYFFGFLCECFVASPWRLSLYCTRALPAVGAHCWAHISTISQLEWRSVAHRLLDNADVVRAFLFNFFAIRRSSQRDFFYFSLCAPCEHRAHAKSLFRIFWRRMPGRIATRNCVAVQKFMLHGNLISDTVYRISHETHTRTQNERRESGCLRFVPHRYIIFIFSFCSSRCWNLIFLFFGARNLCKNWKQFWLLRIWPGVGVDIVSKQMERGMRMERMKSWRKSSSSWWIISDIMGHIRRLVLFARAYLAS